MNSHWWVAVLYLLRTSSFRQTMRNLQTNRTNGGEISLKTQLRSSSIIAYLWVAHNPTSISLGSANRSSQGYNDLLRHCPPLRSFVQSSFEGSFASAFTNGHRSCLCYGKCASCPRHFDIAVPCPSSPCCRSSGGKCAASQCSDTYIDNSKKTGSGSGSMASISCQCKEGTPMIHYGSSNFHGRLLRYEDPFRIKHTTLMYIVVCHVTKGRFETLERHSSLLRYTWFNLPWHLHICTTHCFC